MSAREFRLPRWQQTVRSLSPEPLPGGSQPVQPVLLGVASEPPPFHGMSPLPLQDCLETGLATGTNRHPRFKAVLDNCILQFTLTRR